MKPEVGILRPSSSGATAGTGVPSRARRKETATDPGTQDLTYFWLILGKQRQNYLVKQCALAPKALLASFLASN